jgi:hypothetical protein
MHYFLKFILIKNTTCFGQIYFPSSGVSTLYTQQQVFVMLVMLTSSSEVRMELREIRLELEFHPELASRQST